MPRIRRYLLCLLTLLTGFYHADAQQYPVTASTQIVPPYSVYLPDYAVPGSDKLRVILVQNDLTVPSYDIRLQVTVEQNGTVIMRSSPNFIPKPLTLSPGIPTIIGGTDLADYLNPANIQYSGGFSREVYEKTRSLPEGAYRISFTAYDYRRPQVQVSNTGANVFFFRKNDPPLLNLPICNSRVEKLDPQFLTFNWSSRNSPSPLPGSGTEYVFSLYEVRPAGSNPDYIVRSAKPIYTLVTEMNTIVYGPGEPQLRDSMQYVWTVQARDKSGRDMFSNNGLGLSCTFNYLGNNPFTQRNIPKPVLGGRSTGQRSVRFSWPLADAGYQVETYRLQYRAAKTGSTEFDWQTQESAGDTAFTANGLEPGRNYEGRLQWKIEGIYGPLSDVVTLKTDSAKTFVCGDPALMTAPANKEPLASAHVGSIFRVGNYDVILTEVSGSGGKFTGKGRVITLGFGIGLQMEFKDVTVNTDMVVTGGEMHAVTEGIDKFIQDKVEEQRGGNDVGKVKTGDIVPDITTKLKIFSPANIKVDTDAGTITLKDSETGKEEVINYKDKGKTLPLVLEDADGNLYNIDKGGKVTSAGKRDSSLTKEVLESLKTLNLSKGTVTFAANEANAYAFDEWKETYKDKTVLESKYESLADGKYRVSAKAIVPGVQEELVAVLKGAGTDVTASKLKFVTGKGIVLESKDLGSGKYSVKVTGGPGGDAQEIYAAYPDGKGGYVSMGKLLVVSYTPVNKTLVLVPVGKATTVPEDAIRTALQKAYAKVGITYTVQVDESFRENKDWDTNGDDILQDKGSAFLSNNFTGEEKAIKKAYKKAADISKDAVYLFVINEVALTDGDLLGKMPRQSQFGFVFTKGAAESAVVHTVAHEIGHGEYTLEHTFSEGVGLAKQSTENLMDYGAGYALLKYQWDILHDPGSVWGIFEGDGDSENYLGENISTKFINKDNKTVSFLSPAGVVLSLPMDSLIKVEFQYGAVAKDQYNNLNFGPELTVGALRRFELLNNKNQLETYFYYDNEGVYRSQTTGELFRQDVNPAMVDGFVYPVEGGGKMTMFKFSVGAMPLYKGGEKGLTFTEFADRFKPFGDNRIMLKGADTIRQDTRAAVNEKCIHCMSESTISMIVGHNRAKEYLWVDKIAQIRHVYPEYFTRFTQPEIVTIPYFRNSREEGDWEMPKTLNVRMNEPGGDDGYSEKVYDTSYVWGKYLKDHPDVKQTYTSSKEQFFRTFYVEFVKFIATAVVTDGNFWDNISSGTPEREVSSHVTGDPIFRLKSVAVDKKGIALKILTDNYRSQSHVTYLRLLSSFTPEQYEEALKYIQLNIGVKPIYDNVTGVLESGDAKVGVLMMLSNMITASGYVNNKLEEKIDEIDNSANIPELEADMLQFRNADIKFTGANEITINKKPYAFNDIVSVRIAGTFTVGDKTFQRGSTLEIPAIQVALMESVANSQVTEKTAWLVFDVGTLVLGVGSAKILISAGNYVRKAIVAADMISSVTGIGLQLLNNDAISDELRSSLQIACFVASLPNMAAAIPKIDRLVTKLDDAIKARKALKAAQTTEELAKTRQLETVRDELSKAGHFAETKDLAEFENRVVSLGGSDVTKAESWVKAAKSSNDKNIYIVIHGDGNTFNVMHNGEEVVLTHRSLATWLRNNNKIVGEGQLVLLSCANIETAQHLSRNLGRSIVANDGPVKVYKNGAIEAEGGFKYIDESGNIDDVRKPVVGKQEIKEGEHVELGKRKISPVPNVAAMQKRFGIPERVAQKLLMNKSFMDACEANTRLISEIEFNLPKVPVEVNGIIYASYREAMLTRLSEYPTMFDRIKEPLDKAHEIMAAGKLDTDAYEKLAYLRGTLTDVLEEKGFEVAYFSNGFFSANIYNFLELDATGARLLSDARTGVLKSLPQKSNALVVQMKMKNVAKEKVIYAHSGASIIDGTCPPVSSDRFFEQFDFGQGHRAQDSESKFFEDLYRKITSKKSDKIDPADIEQIILHSERPVCPSCANVIRIFKQNFGVEIIVHEGRVIR